MSYFRLINDTDKEINQYTLTETLKGVFINAAYESNKSKCAEAYTENFLYSENIDLISTVSRLREILSSTMLPIKEIECSPTQLCSIKCEDYDVKVEIENTGPFEFNLADEVYVIPPIPNSVIDIDRLRIDISPRSSFLKPIIVPHFEICNILDDAVKVQKETEPNYESILFKTFNDIGDHVLEMFLSGLYFAPCGYVVSKSGHEPPDMKAVSIKPNHRFVMKVLKPSTLRMPNFVKLFHIDD